MTRDGAPAPVASIARSNASCGAAASMRTLVSQAVAGTQLHAAVGAQVVEQRVGRRRAVVERQAVVAGRARAGAPGGGRSAGRRRPRRAPSAVLPRARMRSGTHGLSVGMVTWTGVPSPTAWPRSAAASASNTAARKIGLRAA